MVRRILIVIIASMLAAASLSGTLVTAGASGKPAAFEVRDGELYDAKGRIAYFRGVNIAGNAKLSEDSLPFQPEETVWWDYLKEWGFNLARFCVFWQAIEPEKGFYDEGYLDKVEQLLEKAARRRIYIIVDMHQDLFSRWTAGDGAPRWAVQEAGVDPDRNNAFGGQYWGLAYTFSSDVRKCFTYFWKSEEMREHYRNALVRVAERLRDNPFVIGYDIMNEPSMGDISNASGRFENEYLKPFYEETISAIREVDADAIGFVEPNLMDMYWSKLTPFSLDRLVYAPHLYDSISGPLHVMVLPPYLVYSVLYNNMKHKARELGMPLLIGEFGAPWDMKPWFAHDKMVNDSYRVFESTFTSCVQWDYSVRDVNVWNGEDFSLIDSEGKPRGLEIAARPYVRRLKGKPLGQSFCRRTRRYVLEFTGGSRRVPTVIFVPASVQYPGGFRVQVSDGNYSYDPETGEIRYRCGSESGKHRVVITPGN